MIFNIYSIWKYFYNLQYMMFISLWISTYGKISLDKLCFFRILWKSYPQCFPQIKKPRR